MQICLQKAPERSRMLYLELDIPKVVLTGLNAPRGLYPRRVNLWIFSIEEITYAGLLALR